MSIIMKFIAIFSLALAVASADEAWKLAKISDGIADPMTEGALRTVLENAAETLVYQSIYGFFGSDTIYNDPKDTAIITSPGSIGRYTVKELNNALNTSEPSVFKPFFQSARNELMYAARSEKDIDKIEVRLPALLVTYLNQTELEATIEDTADDEFKSYLEAALDKLKYALEQAKVAGQKQGEKIQYKGETYNFPGMIVVAVPIQPTKMNQNMPLLPIIVETPQPNDDMMY